MSVVSEHVAKLKEFDRDRLRLRIGAATRAYVTDTGMLCMQGGAFKAEEALVLALWIMEVYGNAEDTY